MLYQNQKGAAAIEFAIVLPMILLLVFGMIEYGLMFYDKQVITNATREGARAAITGDYTDTEVQQIVQNYCDGRLVNLNGSNDLPLGNIVIAPVGSDDLSVTVSYNYDMMMSGIIGVGQVTVSARTIMRMEPS